MRIVMTQGQWLSMNHWGTDRHKEYLSIVTPVGHRRSVAMPYAGWVSLATLLRQEAFTKWGKGRPSKLTDDAKGTRSALHCIEKHTVALASHPALNAEAVLGSSGRMMSVWGKPEGGWSLTPVCNHPMWVLYPVLDEEAVFTTSGDMAVKLGVITRWKPLDWTEDFRQFDLFPDEDHRGW